MPLSAGTRLGPYEIIGPLGAGGMGEVYRAHDSRLNRDVAIKTLPAAFFDDADRLARLRREAQALAALNHPNIAAIYGIEEDCGVRALVMELVEGPTLAERTAAGPIPVEEALDIARQMADALEAAHEKGIVHRDLKPANVKVTPEGRVKVLDFGLAKAFDNPPAGASSQDSPTLSMAATQAGVILGTAAYMSPEQARGKPVDKRADIWSFGVVLYEMLTGRIAFEGETVSDTLAAVLRAEIDWKRLPAGTPPNVRKLLQRCLERDPRKRLRDIGDARLELEAPEEPAAAPAPRGRSRLWWLPWSVAVALGIDGLSVGWVLSRNPSAPPRPVVRWSYTQKGSFGLPALSRDGTRLAFVEVVGSAAHLTLRMMDQTETKPLPGGEGGSFPVFSPDGQWIAFIVSDGTLKKVRATGGAPITLAEKVGPASDWGENGEILFFGPSGVMKVAAAGGPAQALTTVDSKQGETGHEEPHFLPGEQALLFTVVTGGSQRVELLDLKKGARHTLVNDARGARYVPTGHLVYVRGTTLMAAPFNARRMELTGSETPVFDNFGGQLGAPAVEYSFANSGLLVYMDASMSGKTFLGWADRKGMVEPFTALESWGTGRLSPDGHRVANSIRSGQRAEEDIWIYDVDRRTKERLTPGGLNEYPIWTPDGRRVTFGAASAGKHGIYSIPADGSGKAELLLATEEFARPTSWSPDGKALVYSMLGTGHTFHLWVLPVGQAGSPLGPPAKPYRLHDTAFYEDEGQASPDGAWLAYISGESGTTEVYVQPFPGPGAKVRISTEGGQYPRWSKNGRELFYWDMTRSKVLSADVETRPQFRAGIPHQLFAQNGASTWDVAPDGQRFLIEQYPGGASSREMQVVVDWFEELGRRVPAGK